MSIRRKLLLLLVAILVAFFLMVSLYFYMLSPIDRFKEERDSLIGLATSFRDLRGELSRLDNTGFSEQIEEIMETEAAMDGAFEKVENFQYLPEASPDLKKAVVAITGLKNLIYMNWEKLIGALPEMEELGYKLLFSKNAQISDDALQGSRIGRFHSDGSVARARQLWREISMTLTMLDSTLNSSISVIDEQFVRIDDELEKLQTRATLFALMAILGLVIAVFLAALYFTRAIVLNIRRIEGGIDTLSTGELGTKIKVKSRDELAGLSENLNSFIGKLNAGLQEIKDSIDQNVGVKDTLTEQVDLTIDGLTRINQKNSDIGFVVGSLNESIEVSSEGVELLGSNVDKMTSEIQNQTAMVEEASSSVHQMIASIRNVADITRKKGAATGILVETARTGGSHLENTTRIIREIHDSVDEISGTAAVIQSVASQTNLLAMNAAIEAAHAGDAGRGFAVVADEIRKLAETSSLNSKRISGVIKDVISNIEEAVASGLETQYAFTSIDDEVQGVSRSLEEISSSMSELNLGGEQILKAMDELQNVSSAVTGSGRELREVADQFNSQIKRMEKASTEVKRGTGEIETAVGGISSSIEKINGFSKELDDVSESLASGISRYHDSSDEGESA